MNVVNQPYIAKPVDKHGFVNYSCEENQLWSELLERQVAILKDRACDEYLKGLALLNLPTHRIPQCNEINLALETSTSWTLEPVSSLIPANDFFHLLANRKFPVATFIRRREDFNYIAEPDIFHEIVGHCPLLMQPAYANFMQAYGKLSISASPAIQTLLERVFFFTIETGLIKTNDGLKIYGGGILSSYDESLYALESPIPKRIEFNINDIIHSTYGLESMQKTYYILDNFEQLNTLLDLDFTKSILFN